MLVSVYANAIAIVFSSYNFLEQVPLPSGGILTPKGLQILGLAGLGSGGGFERLHYM